MLQTLSNQVITWPKGFYQLWSILSLSLTNHHVVINLLLKLKHGLMIMLGQAEMPMRWIVMLVTSQQDTTSTNAESTIYLWINHVITAYPPPFHVPPSNKVASSPYITPLNPYWDQPNTLRTLWRPTRHGSWSQSRCRWELPSGGWVDELDARQWWAGYAVDCADVIYTAVVNGFLCEHRFICQVWCVTYFRFQWHCNVLKGFREPDERAERSRSPCIVVSFIGSSTQSNHVGDWSNGQEDVASMSSICVTSSTWCFKTLQSPSPTETHDSLSLFCPISSLFSKSCWFPHITSQCPSSTPSAIPTLLPSSNANLQIMESFLKSNVGKTWAQNALLVA